MAQSRARLSHDDEDYPQPISPRIQDVARRAGVAIGTVSNVLNNPEIDPLTCSVMVNEELGGSLPPISSIEEHTGSSSSPAFRSCD